MSKDPINLKNKSKILVRKEVRIRRHAILSNFNQMILNKHLLSEQYYYEQSVRNYDNDVKKKLEDRTFPHP